ncbi:MAG: V-type ATP synthase subunit F [archaeon]
MANNMMSVVIGDEFFVAGFLYGGFDRGIVVKDRKDVKIKINEAIEKGDAGLIVVEKSFVDVDDEGFIKRLKADASMPLVVDIDGGYGNG